MNRKTLLVLMGFVLFSCNSETPKRNSNLTEQIISMLHAQTTAWNNGSIDSFMSNGYWNSDSLQFITPKGVKYGYQSVLKSYKRSYPNKEAMGHLEFTNLKVMTLDDNNEVYQVFGNWNVIKDSMPVSGVFSLIVNNINGHPRIVIDHTY